MPHARFLKKDLFYSLLYECMSLCTYIHMCTDAHRGQKIVSDPPGARVTSGCKSCDTDAGNQNSRLLHEQYVLLTMEPSLQTSSGGS